MILKEWCHKKKDNPRGFPRAYYKPFPLNHVTIFWSDAPKSRLALRRACPVALRLKSSRKRQKENPRRCLHGLESFITPKACISSMRSIAYHQHEVLCMPSANDGLRPYCIKPQEYTLRAMRYTFGDDIHAGAWWYAKPAAWIKKERSMRFVLFWLPLLDLNQWHPD